MKVKTAELQGAALDWAVAAALHLPGLALFHDRRRFGGDKQYPTVDCSGRDGLAPLPPIRYCPSVDWLQGGPLIELHCISLEHIGADAGRTWCATPRRYYHISRHGETLLIAAMRAVVAMNVSGDIDIPDELVQGVLP